MKKYKNYLIILTIVISFLVGVCFIPVGISKFIPIIEQQVEADLGIKVHLDKLIMRVGQGSAHHPRRLYHIQPLRPRMPGRVVF